MPAKHHQETKPHLEGVLRKWTNYWNGWQDRWFVLDKGTLTYYLSKDTIHDGCKASISLSVADISAHPTDCTRLEIRVPGEQHLFLKAGTAQLRQEWLVALGSAKSALSSSSTTTARELHATQAKISEVRLYCDLLVQQVHSIKTAATDNAAPDAEKLDYNASMLADTCDTFIRAVEECLQLALHTSDPKAGSTSQSDHTHRNSSSRCDGVCGARNARLSGGSREEVRRGTESEKDKSGESDLSPPPSPRPPSTQQSPETLLAQAHPNSFFAHLDASFSDIVLENDGSVPTLPFLNSCFAITRLFDLLGSTAFAPVKMDMNGNVRKLRNYHDSDPQRFRHLQALLAWEIQRGTSNSPNSATDALLWLKRGIWFLGEFLEAVVAKGSAGEEIDLTECATTAYDITLKQHHGWVVRGVFSLAVKAMPPWPDFLGILLGLGEEDEIRGMPDPVRSAIVAYTSGIRRSLRSLHNYYSQHRLYPDGFDS